MGDVCITDMGLLHHRQSLCLTATLLPACALLQDHKASNALCSYQSDSCPKGRCLTQWFCDIAATLCIITMLRVNWDKEALKAKKRLQVLQLLLYNSSHHFMSQQGIILSCMPHVHVLTQQDVCC